MQEQAGLHVGVILDGNRRWAKKHGLPIAEGHRRGIENAKALIDWCHELGVAELTLYTFSQQNFRRPVSEIKDLFAIFREYFTQMLTDYRLHEYQIRIRIAGKLDKFPPSLRKILVKLMEMTNHYNKYKINFALGYGGREELVEATRALAREVKTGTLKPEQITERLIEQHLSVTSEPDIVIRTGGEVRTSNFLPWQTIYSEWFFLKKQWPAFTKADLVKILADFRTRNRNFGA